MCSYGSRFGNVSHRLGRKRCSFLSTAALTIDDGARRRETGEALNSSHRDRTRVEHNSQKSKICGVPSLPSGEGWTSTQRSGASMIRLSDLGHTVLNQCSDIERGALSSGSQNPPAGGPEISALRGVRGLLSQKCRCQG